MQQNRPMAEAVYGGSVVMFLSNQLFIVNTINAKKGDWPQSAWYICVRVASVFVLEPGLCLYEVFRSGCSCSSSYKALEKMGSPTISLEYVHFNV